jgi:hypothetical protein
MMAALHKPWRAIAWTRPGELGDESGGVAAAFAPDVPAPPIAPEGPAGLGAALSLRAAFERLGVPRVEGTPLNEARTLLKAAAEVEHSLMVEYLYAAWSLLPDPGAKTIVDIAVQEMCHFLTVQNLLLAVGGEPSVLRQDQDPAPELDPFPFTLRPFSKVALEDFLLAEMPAVDDMTPDQRKVMEPIIKAHAGHAVHPVGLIYAQLYWLFQKDDQPTPPWTAVASQPLCPGRHLDSLPGEATVTTFQADATQEKWHPGSARGGILKTIATREDALEALFEIASQGEGLVGHGDQPSHFSKFFDIYTHTDFGNLPSARWPTDPFLSSTPDPDPQRELNRIANPAAAALCAVFDCRYRIALASLRAALARNRADSGDLALRTKYISWCFDEMLGFIKRLGAAIGGMKRGADASLAAAPTFAVGDTALPDDAAGLDDALHKLHVAADRAIALALAAGPDAAAKALLQQMQAIDKKRFP